MKTVVSFTLNGRATELATEPYTSLLDALRNRAELTGTKKGCDVGDCGACTVIVDGKPLNSCLVLAAEVEGASVETIEGLAASPEQLHPLQQSFLDCGAAQCGFCTPGLIMMAKALLAENPRPTRDEIRFAIAGNICRCTGYTKVFEAIEQAAARMAGEVRT
ncbi:MAG: (2Fe-2S)-binding protein [Burkholderiales bacterium]|nr:(2Fe-2S)-binding protein [Burkholderiales bacterium]